MSAPATFADYPAAIQAHLDGGGTPATLYESLSQLGAVAQNSGTVQLADFTGDQVPEWVVSIQDPTVEPLGPLPPGQLYIFMCQAGAYQQAYDSGYTEDSSLPTVQATTDVTADGQNDLLYTVSLCGAHTCFDTLSVIRWNGTAFGNVVVGDSMLSYSTIRTVPGSGDAVNIEMYGGTIGSVGAGPQRPRTKLWGWNGSAIVLLDTQLDPALYRFHLVNDADDAAANGEASLALELYTRVIDDDALLSWEAVTDEREHLEGYALYRSMILHLLAGNGLEADAARNKLTVFFAAGVPGAEWSPVADIFWARHAQDGDPSAACLEAVSYVEQNPTTLDFLNSYGYENRPYEALSVCPY
jgi:hypothetical protein